MDQHVSIVGSKYLVCTGSFCPLSVGGQSEVVRCIYDF